MSSGDGNTPVRGREDIKGGREGRTRNVFCKGEVGEMILQE